MSHEKIKYITASVGAGLLQLFDFSIEFGLEKGSKLAVNSKRNPAGVFSNPHPDQPPFSFDEADEGNATLILSSGICATPHILSPQGETYSFTSTEHEQNKWYGHPKPSAAIKTGKEIHDLQPGQPKEIVITNTRNNKPHKIIAT